MNAEKLLTESTVTVANAGEVPAAVRHLLSTAPKLYFDTETDGLSPWKNDIALMQFFDPESKQVLLMRTPKNWRADEWTKSLWSKDRTFVGHNLSGFDLFFMPALGIPWKNSSYFDTLVAETICTTSGRSDTRRNLAASVKRRTGIMLDKDIEHGGWRNETLNEKQIQYATTDVLVLPELEYAQNERATESRQNQALAEEMAVLPAFVQMTINGLPINHECLDEYLRQQEVNMKNAEVLLNRRLGGINYGSPVQLKKALAKTGIELDSTNKQTLIDTILFDPESENAKLLQAILDWRGPNKRNSMYGSAEWQEENIQPDGRIHARFWQVGADTFRTSSSSPNLQQVPKDGRWIFGGIPGWKIVSCDYSQIEVRIAAEVAKDDVLMKSLEAADVHTSIASQIFKCSPSEVTKSQRKMAKALVFTLLFGGSALAFYNYARRNGSTITEGEAVDMFNAFFDAFPGLHRTRQMAYALARNRRVNVITLPNGARRVLVGQKNSPQVILNTTVQGPAALGMKYGMLEALRRGLDKYLCATVHDELVAFVPEKEAIEYGRELQDSMVLGMQRILHKCPVAAELTIKDTW